MLVELYAEDKNLYQQGCRGLVVKTSGWPSFDRQFEPYPRSIKAAPLRCGLDAVPNFDGRIHQKMVLHLACWRHQ